MKAAIERRTRSYWREAMSEYLVLIYDAESPYANGSPELWQEVMDAHQRFVEHVAERGGRILGTRAVQPTARATTIRDGAVSHGPFVHTPEVFCGYYLIEASSDEHALEIAMRCPAKFGGVEVRPIMPTPVSV
jgi:hypothetical protein